MFKDFFKSKAGLKIKDDFPYIDLFDSIGIGAALISPQMEILFLNKVLKRWFPNINLTKKPICYKSFNIPPQNKVCSYCPTIKALTDGKVHEAITETPAGKRVVNYRIIASPLKDSSGSIIAAIEIVEDITEHRRMDEALRASEQKFKDLIETTTDWVWEVDKNGVYTYASPKVKELLGYEVNEVLGKTPFDLMPEEEAEKIGKFFKDKAIRKEPFYRLENINRHKDGHLVILETSGIPLFDVKGQLKGYRGIDREITERKKLQEQLRISEEKYRKIFEEANDAIFIADPETGQIMDANKQAEELLGKTRQEICRMHQSQLHPPEEAARYKEAFKRDTKEGHAVDFEAEVINKDGVIIPVFISTSTQEISGKKVIQGIFRDVSQLKKIEAEKKEADLLALIDPLTQLYNYRYLQRRLGSEFEAAKRHVAPLSLLMIDIDYFKSINDTYGHEFGDGVLQEFASLLQRNCREIDVVTRYGGEEFAIILPDTDGKGALSFGQRIQDAINKHKFGRYKVKLKTSIGIASHPEDRIKTVDGLLTNAEKGLRIAKEKGGNTIYTCRQIQRKGVETSVIDAVSKRKVKEISRKFTNLIKRNDQNIIEAVYALAHTVGVKDAYTEEHSEDMIFYATEIGKKLSLSEEELEDLKHGAMLHDIGKIGISDGILLKRGKLTKKEFKEVQKHPQIGADIIRPVHFLKDVVPLILHHHERYNGYGYRSKLQGEEIPLGARIIGLVDAYQALTSNRPYRRAYSKKEAQKIIKEESGRHFDPELVKTFLEILQRKERSGKR